MYEESGFHKATKKRDESQTRRQAERHIPDCLGRLFERALKSLRFFPDSHFVRLAKLRSKWLGAELGARFARKKR
jgi:hypothetical protein